MIEDVIVKNIPKCKNPYDFYYKKTHQITSFNDIKEFYIGDKIYNLTYTSRPRKNYNRIAKWDDFGDGMKIIKKNGKETQLKLKEYIKLLKKFGTHNEFSSLKGVKILHKR